MARVYSGGRSRELATLHERAGKAAAALEALGVRPGDTIAAFLRNDFVNLEASLAARRLGAWVTPVNWHSTTAEARYVFEDSGAKAVVIHADLLAGIPGAIPDGVEVLVVPTPADILADYGIDPALAEPPAGARTWDAFLEPVAPLPAREVPALTPVIYTSGTTGRPKGVRRGAAPGGEAQSVDALNRTVYGLDGWLHRLEEVVLEVAGPLYHAGPSGWSLHFVQTGCNVVLDPRFDAERTLQNIERYKVTHLLAVPTMFVRLLKLPREVREKYDLSSLKFVLHGAAPCPPHAKAAMIEWLGPILCETYGSTEVGSLTVCYSQDWLDHPGTVGKPIPGTEIRILGPDRQPLPTGQVGEIAARRVAAGDFTYHGDDAKRAAMSRDGGLVALGDAGFLDEDGFLHLSGRMSDMVISGGVNIYPAEIEAELLQMPGVLDCAVFGIPDDEFGEQLCAYIQPQPGAAPTADEVRAFVRERLSAYKAPRRVVFADELPREDSGKIFKRKLRAPYWEAAGRDI